MFVGTTQFRNPGDAEIAAKIRAGVAANATSRRQQYLQEHSSGEVYSAIGKKYKEEPAYFDGYATTKGYIMESPEYPITKEEKDDVLSIVLNSGNKFKYDKVYEYYYNKCFYIVHHQLIMFKYRPENPFVTVEADKGYPDWQQKDKNTTQATIENYIEASPILFKRGATPEEIAEETRKTNAEKQDFQKWSKQITPWLVSVQKFAIEKGKGAGWGTKFKLALTGNYNTKTAGRNQAGGLEKAATIFLNIFKQNSYLTQQDDVAASNIKVIKRDIESFVKGGEVIVKGYYVGTISHDIKTEYGKRYPNIFGDLKLREVLGYLKTSTAPAVGGYRKKQRKTRRSKKSRKATRRRR